MTVDELNTQLSDLSAQVDSFDLQMLVWQIEKQTAAAAFDPLLDLSVVAGPEIERIEELIPQVDQAMATEAARAQLVQTIISLAAGALRAAGVALP